MDSYIIRQGRIISVSTEKAPKHEASELLCYIQIPQSSYSFHFSQQILLLRLRNRMYAADVIRRNIAPSIGSDSLNIFFSGQIFFFLRLILKFLCCYYFVPLAPPFISARSLWSSASTFASDSRSLNVFFSSSPVPPVRASPAISVNAAASASLRTTFSSIL